MSLDQRVILFDEALHKYTDECGNVYTSATQLIGKYEKEFNHRYWCMYTALKRSGYFLVPDNNEQYITINRRKFHIDDLYNGKVYISTSIENITTEWKEKNRISCERGTGIHNFIEDRINILTGNQENLNINFNTIVLNPIITRTKFACKRQIHSLSDLDDTLKDKFPIVFRKVMDLLSTGWKIFAELRIYHPDFLIAGTIDLVAFDGKGNFVILDWKTNKKELHFRAGYYKKVNGIETNIWIPKQEYFKYPIDNIEQCKGEGYTLQLSLYAHILECWGFKCKGLAIIHMMPNTPEKFIKIKYRKNEVDYMMKHHYENLNKKTQTLLSIK